VADVQVIAATNADLDSALGEGRIRPDLFYGLNVITVTLPPLRERREDRAALARHFLARYAAEFCSPPVDFSDRALQMLLTHHWPGNVGELENLIARCAAMADREQIEPEDSGLSNAALAGRAPRAPSLREAKAQFERNAGRFGS
jgi:DNA-binding NtrC family response regulator